MPERPISSNCKMDMLHDECFECHLAGPFQLTAVHLASADGPRRNINQISSKMLSLQRGTIINHSDGSRVTLM